MSDEFKLQEIFTNSKVKLSSVHYDNAIVIVDNSGERNFDAALKGIGIINRKQLSVVYIQETRNKEVDSLLETFEGHVTCTSSNFTNVLRSVRLLVNNEIYHKEKLSNIIQELFYKFQMSPSNKGFDYLKTAIIHKTLNENLRNKDLCEVVARSHQATADRVTRCMRTILVATKEKNNPKFMELFKKEKVSTMTFIVVVANLLRKELQD